MIVLDDGLATGATIQAVVRSVQKHEPARLIAAFLDDRAGCVAKSNVLAGQWYGIPIVGTSASLRL